MLFIWIISCFRINMTLLFQSNFYCSCILYSVEVITDTIMICELYSISLDICDSWKGLRNKSNFSVNIMICHVLFKWITYFVQISTGSTKYIEILSVIIEYEPSFKYQTKLESAKFLILQIIRNIFIHQLCIYTIMIK